VSNWLGFLLILLTGGAIFAAGRMRARHLVGGRSQNLHSKPDYHGAYLLIWSLLPALLFNLIWLFAARYVHDLLVAAQLGRQFSALGANEQSSLLSAARAVNSGSGFGNITPMVERAGGLYGAVARNGAVAVQLFSLGLVAFGFYWGWRKIAAQLRARQFVETVVVWILGAASGVAIVTTIGIILSLIFETLQFFRQVSLLDFFFGTHWSPQSAFTGAGALATSERNSQIFGAIPVFAGTFLITGIAILVAAPIGLMAAIYLSDYATPRARAFAKPMLEILAGIPTVVYGFFAALTVAPFFRQSGESLGLTVSSESALAAGIVMGIMIIPFVSSLSDDVINAVPQSLRDGSAALGATKSETIRKVVLPAALPGIVSALMLAISRAIGETMIVVMAAGLSAKMTINPLDAVTTVTVQIVTLLTGDSEFDSAKTLSAFALGLVLFLMTLALNVIALQVVRKYQEQYD